MSVKGFLSLVSRVSYNLQDFLSSLFLWDKSSVLVYVENDQCVCVCVCFSSVSSLKSIFMYCGFHRAVKWQWLRNKTVTEAAWWTVRGQFCTFFFVFLSPRSNKRKSGVKIPKKVSCEVQQFVLTREEEDGEEEGKDVRGGGVRRWGQRQWAVRNWGWELIQKNKTKKLTKMGKQTFFTSILSSNPNAWCFSSPTRSASVCR